MKHALGLKLSQGLSLTPALQQAIKLLQMSTLDLQQEIQDALEGNLMLERDDSEQEAAAATPTDSREERPASDNRENAEVGENDQIPDELPNDFEWDDVYTSTSSGDREADQALYDYRQANIHSGPDLKTHLQDQIAIQDLSEAQALAIDHLIDALDERGFLCDPDNTAQQIAARCAISEDEMEDLLARLQACDPSGVGARNLSECLLIQLAGLPESPSRALARCLVRDHLDVLGQPKPYARLRHILPGPEVSEEAFEQALSLLRGLTLDPGAGFIPHEQQYVAPDVYVRKIEGHWLASINPEIAPKLRINGTYQDLVKRADTSPDQKLLKQHLQEARYFLHSLKSRNETLLKVAQEIVDRQRGFLEYGPEAMRPLVLRDIAGKLGIHESTVSRATAHKYMHTPRGLYELKYFFSSAVSTAEGGSCSATAIQAMIRRLVNEENPAKPLSDNRLTQILKDEGIQVARRTVAKYREGMNIPPSHERKRMA